MPGTTLSTELRRSLDKTIREARQVAEVGAQDAIRRLGVAEASAPIWLDEQGKALRRRLRAHARSLGDAFDRTTERQEVDHLVGATAYAHWHRMLFARFLAERDLLRHPEHDVAISLADCEELAAAENLPDRWAVAERYAAAMLPGVFLPEDPVLALEVAPEHTHRLQILVQDLDGETFKASDSLGWTYQFWRGAEKDAVNKSGVKIGADELPAVTQLFTEPYMVRFLLHNTLGAWWAGKVLAQRPGLAATAADEVTLRTACALPGVTWEMLRFIREGDVWRPASGTFPGWPNEAKAITLLDPCCGSGHFLTEALPILAALRQAQEGTSVRDAIAAVLWDNLFGLEIDGRCVQIAAFAVALNAWAVGGWQKLPQPHIAWVGAPPPLPRQEFMAMANGDEDLRAGLAALHDLFSQAPILGSLIEPTGGDLMSPQRLGRIAPLLDRLLGKVRRATPETAEGVIAARGMADAARILSLSFTLVSTNVPFLGQRNQAPQLVDYLCARYPDTKNDLAFAFFERIGRFLAKNGTLSIVSPQSCLYGWSYKAFRKRLIRKSVINFLAPLGSRAFETITGEVVNVCLYLISNAVPDDLSAYYGVDANNVRTPKSKIEKLLSPSIQRIEQFSQTKNPDFRIQANVSKVSGGETLENLCSTFQGIKTGDDFRWLRKFWEFLRVSTEWKTMQTTVERDCLYGGGSVVVYWGEDGRHLIRRRQEGQDAAKKYRAIAISQMGTYPCSIMNCQAFDSNVSPLFVHDDDNFTAIFVFVSSLEYKEAVRCLEPEKNVNNSTLLKVSIDLERWKSEAEDIYPNGIPEPSSNFPTECAFHGHPALAALGTALHVALARLAGYRWPAESDAEIRLSADARDWIVKAMALPSADDDGILCVPAVAGERSLADRLRTFLAAAFGPEWSEAKERELIVEADKRFEKKAAKDQSLEGWLRERAFQQHCRLFQDRPVLWQVWDGMKDGFSAFLHYHRLDQATLRKLTYTTLGDWLARAKAEGSVPRQEKGRELQQKLEKILEGEAPYDIFVRWKPLARQPLGWDPDLDDGVRMNIRPFMTAGILRDSPNIKWGKDRGTDVASAPWYSAHNGERINDHHTTLAEKRAARGEVN